MLGSCCACAKGCPCRNLHIAGDPVRIGRCCCPMVQLLRLLCGALIGLFQSSARREAEILVLRQQINVLRRRSSKRPALNNADRLLFVWLSRLVPTTLAALAVVSPGKVIPLDRARFLAYLRSRSRAHVGPPTSALD